MFSRSVYNHNMINMESFDINPRNAAVDLIRFYAPLLIISIFIRMQIV